MRCWCRPGPAAPTNPATSACRSTPSARSARPASPCSACASGDSLARPGRIDTAAGVLPSLLDPHQPPEVQAAAVARWPVLIALTLPGCCFGAGPATPRAPPTSWRNCSADAPGSIRSWTRSRAEPFRRARSPRRGGSSCSRTATQPSAPGRRSSSAARPQAPGPKRSAL